MLRACPLLFGFCSFHRTSFLTKSFCQPFCRYIFGRSFYMLRNSTKTLRKLYETYEILRNSTKNLCETFKQRMSHRHQKAKFYLTGRFISSKTSLNTKDNVKICSNDFCRVSLENSVLIGCHLLEARAIVVCKY